jgi:hypothetical protein
METEKRSVNGNMSLVGWGNSKMASRAPRNSLPLLGITDPAVDGQSDPPTISNPINKIIVPSSNSRSLASPSSFDKSTSFGNSPRYLFPHASDLCRYFLFFHAQQPSLRAIGSLIPHDSGRYHRHVDKCSFLSFIRILFPPFLSPIGLI